MLATRDRRRFRTIRSSNYDLNNTCNLFCEGCYYFVSGQKTESKRPTEDEYDRFFAAEAARGVNYPVISGGEPSLNPVGLRAAAKHFDAGIIYTNGAKRISPEVPFRIAVSVWGSRSDNDKIRGLASYDQAIETAKGDPRALIYYTISRHNIDQIRQVVEHCVAEDLKISFNDYSMTTEFIRLMQAEAPEDNPFVRSSTRDENPSLRTSDRLRIADILDDLLDRYPDHIIFNKTLNHWLHREPAIHTIDPMTGIATDCAMMNAEWHRGYDFALRRLGGKPCCAPEFDCADCRVGPVATFSLLNRLAESMRHSPAARAQYLDTRSLMMRFHYWDWHDVAAPAQSSLLRMDQTVDA